MARIAPVPEITGRTEGLPTVYQRPVATPQGQGAGFGDVLEQGAAVGRQYLDEVNRNAVQGVTGQARNALDADILDPKTGYLSTRGEAAMAARSKALGDYDKKLNDLNAGLSTEQQKMFAPHAQSLREQAFGHVIQHEAHEQESYAQANYRGNVDSAVTVMERPSVVASPKAIQTQIDSLYQAGIDEAKRRYGPNASKEAIASVVTPELQRAAYSGMQTAVALAESADNPALASDAFKVLGPKLVTAHQEHYAAVIQGLQAKKAIKDAATAAVNPAATSVPVPGGAPVVRYDPTKVSANLVKSKDSPYLPEIQKAVKARQDVGDAQWNDTVTKIYTDAFSEGQDPATADFDLARVSIEKRTWLSRYAPQELDKLRMISERGDKAQRTKDSHEALNKLRYAVATDKEPFLAMSVPDYRKFITDLGVVGNDQKDALTLYDHTQKGGLTERVGTTVREHLEAALPGPTNAKKRERLFPLVYAKAQKFAQDWQRDTEGKIPDTDKIGKVADFELRKVKVAGAGLFGYFDTTARQIEAETTPEFRGRGLTPADAAAIEAAIPTPPPRTSPPQAAAVPAAVRTAPVAPTATARRPQRTVGGVTKEWNGAAWVAPGSP